MTRDERFTERVRDARATVQALTVDAGAFEQHAANEDADLHAVLYGKVADALDAAVEALNEAEALIDPAADHV